MGHDGGLIAPVLLRGLAFLLLFSSALLPAQPEGLEVTLEVPITQVFPFQTLDVKVIVSNKGSKSTKSLSRTAILGPKSLLCARPAAPTEQRKGEWAELVSQPSKKPLGALHPGESFTMSGRFRIPSKLRGEAGLVHLQWVCTRGALKGVRSQEIQLILRKGDNPIATIATAEGSILLELWPDKAPNHVANFIELARAGKYDGRGFHRAVANFMIQGGCSKGDGSGNEGYTIAAEFNDTEFKKGVLGMARGQSDDSASGQFFICTGDSAFLNGKYTAFGKVLFGQDVADGITRKPHRRPPDQELLVDPVVMDRVVIEAPEGYENPGVTKVTNKD